MASASKYTGDDIQVLEGLDPVRKRPGMYIGGTGKDGYHHLLWEVVDNSIDEVINKHATKVEVTLHKDGKTCTVEDNGRGIPVDVMSKQKKPAIEVIYTTLHSGGKFERGKSYAVSGGLHGVGAAVVNALSSELIAQVKRDGERYEIRFERGETKGKLKKLGGARGTGTLVTFHPDDEVFGGKLKFDPSLIAERLEAKSYLHGGLEITFTDETQAPAVTHTYVHPQGIAEYLPTARHRPQQAAGAAGRCRVLHGEAGQGPAARRRARAAVDRGDRRADQDVRQLGADARRRHPRCRLARGRGQGDPQLHRHAQARSQGRHAHRRGHPRGSRRRAVDVRPRPAVPEPDQEPAQQPRGRQPGRAARAPGDRELPQRESRTGRRR